MPLWAAHTLAASVRVASFVAIIIGLVEIAKTLDEFYARVYLDNSFRANDAACRYKRTECRRYNDDQHRRRQPKAVCERTGGRNDDELADGENDRRNGERAGETL